MLVVAWQLAACSAGGPLLERLDERSGVTLVSSREPLVFARTEPRYSRSERDYVYVGPVETNRQGAREYYLWVGMASTLDRGFIAPVAEAPRTLYVTVEGEPIELPLRPWHEVVSTQIDAPIYATAVRVRAEFAARVTLQQIALLDEQPVTTIAVSFDATSAPRNYARWGDGAGFGDFVTRQAERSEISR
jgi:hypothetical protein